MPSIRPDLRPEPPLLRAGTRQRLTRGWTRPAEAEGAPVVVLGGDGAFGRGRRRPWPARLAALTGRPVLNLGVEGAGPAFLASDVGLMAEAEAALAAGGDVVVEAAGLWAGETRWYAAGRRQPRRLRAVSPALRALYPELALDGIDDLGRLLQLLHARDPARFEQLAAEARAVWLREAEALLRRLGPGVLALAPGGLAPAGGIGATAEGARFGATAEGAPFGAGASGARLAVDAAGLTAGAPAPAEAVRLAARRAGARAPVETPVGASDAVVAEALAAALTRGRARRRAGAGAAGRRAAVPA